MFHRVKSEVHENEQKNQSLQDAETGFENTTDQTVSASSQDQDVDDGNDAVARSYTSATPTTAAQKETKAMDDTIIQGKYARDTEARNETPVTGYSRPGQSSPISRPSAYPGSYSASSASAPSASPYTTQAAADYSPMAGDRCLRIGRGINMSGEIEACDHLLVEGTVEAALKGAKVLEIAESGTFYGTVEIEEATIAGRFEGDITVNGRLTISSTGTITGSIAYRELEVEAGAMLDGRMTPLKSLSEPKASSDNAYRSAATDASAMAKAKEIVSKKDNREPANTEHGLFSKAHATSKF